MRGGLLAHETQTFGGNLTRVVKISEAIAEMVALQLKVIGNQFPNVGRYVQTTIFKHRLKTYYLNSLIFLWKFASYNTLNSLRPLFLPANDKFFIQVFRPIIPVSHHFREISLF